jgi:hypothetical protein
VALGLFREANASNNDYLSFLFFWQVLEVGGGEPVTWVNEVYQKRLPDLVNLSLDLETIARLPLGARTLGDYFEDDCRHAIAHIRRYPGKKTLDVDMPSERIRLARSVDLIRELAEHYIREELGLKSYLHLAYRKKSEIPEFVPPDAIWNGYHFVIPPPVRLMKSKKRV